MLRLIVDTAINVPGCAKERSVSLEISSTGGGGGGLRLIGFSGFLEDDGCAKGVVGVMAVRCVPSRISLSAVPSVAESRACRLKREFPSSPFLLSFLFALSSNLSPYVFRVRRISPLPHLREGVSLPLRSGRRDNRATKVVL